MERDRIYVSEGITDVQIEQLLYYASTDELVAKYTSDPRRFADRASFEKWKEKGRNIFTLSGKDGSLLGIVWLGKEQMPTKQLIEPIVPEEWGITFAIRIYGETRGKGLAYKFMREAIDSFKRSPTYQQITNKGIWLETSFDNAPALNAYARFGFRQVTDQDEKGKILMVLEE